MRLDNVNGQSAGCQYFKEKIVMLYLQNFVNYIQLMSCITLVWWNLTSPFSIGEGSLAFREGISRQLLK